MTVHLVYISSQHRMKTNIPKQPQIKPKPNKKAQTISHLKQTRCFSDIAVVPDVKRLCGSGVMGQSELPRGEVGKGGRPAGRGLGCLKLLLSEKSDWDSAAAPSKGERAVMSDTLMGTTRLGLVRPGGGEGESLVGIWTERGERNTWHVRLPS